MGLPGYGGAESDLATQNEKLQKQNECLNTVLYAEYKKNAELRQEVKQTQKLVGELRNEIEILNSSNIEIDDLIMQELQSNIGFLVVRQHYQDMEAQMRDNKAQMQEMLARFSAIESSSASEMNSDIDFNDATPPAEVDPFVNLLDLL